MKPIVYLAGPVTGLSFKAATYWRDRAASLLSPAVDVANPMRGCDHLSGEAELKFTYVDHPFTKQRGVMTRDHFDVQRSTALLVNLLGATSKSAGTIMELGWAWSYRKPVVAIMEPEGNPHDFHPMILEAIDFRVPSLIDGINLVRTIVTCE